MRKVVLSLVPLFVVGALLEVGLRHFPIYADAGGTVPGIAVPDSSLIWRLKPQASGPYKTNEIGLRDTPLNKAADRTILLLGDSVSWGDGIMNVEWTYPFILEQQLGQQTGKSFEIINSAVPGYSTFQQYRYFELYGLRFKPDMVLLQFCLNDVVERYATLFQYGGDNVFLGIDTRNAIEGLYGWLVRNSRFFETGVRMLKGAARHRQAYQVEALAVDQPSKQIQEAWNLVLAEIENIRQLAEREKIPLAIVVFPYRFQLQRPEATNQPQLVLNRYAEKEGIPVIDLLPQFAAFQQANRSMPLFFDANHLTIEGHMLAADILAQQLLPENWVGAK